MKKRLIKSALGLIGLMRTLAIGVVNAQEINKDIVIEATSTAANQTLKINKYFANAYMVDWGDGSPIETVSSDKTHKYSVASGYTITLSLTGSATRWTFQRVSKPLVPTNGTTMTGVKIIYMPSMADGFGVTATNPGDFFFHNFNYKGALTSLPEGSFDTSNIIGAGNLFFCSFNSYGNLTSLPTNSFNISKIVTVESNFFSSFNDDGQITSLPEGSFRFATGLTTVGFGFFSNFNGGGSLTSLPENSFDTSKITTVGDDFFYYFNREGKLISLPENSFNTSNISGNVGDYFFSYFNYDGALTSLPENSFDTSKITAVGFDFFVSFNYDGALTSLPENSFNTSNISGNVGDYFFASFNSYGNLTSLPVNSFDTSKITAVGAGFFSNFNLRGALTSLPTNSFNTSKITTVGNDFFSYFNMYGALTGLSENSFDTSNISGSVGNKFFSLFNYDGALTSLPENSFDTSKITTVGDDFFSNFNLRGALTSLPTNSFNTSKITTVGNNFFSSFNSNGKLTSLPEESFDTSNIITTDRYFFYAFNANGALKSLPEGSFDTSSIEAAGDYFFSYFNYGGVLETLPELFTMNSIGASANYGYTNSFNSTGYTLNKKVSDLVPGVTVPSTDRNTFSDNQPGRCGVADNWLVNPATACKAVTFVTNSESTVDSQIVDIDANEKVIKPTDPTKIGHTFTGWYSDENLTELFDFSTVITDDTTLYAKWQVNQYTITLDIDGTLTTITGDYGSPVNKPSNPSKNGYTFKGWEPEIPDTMPAEDMTVKAKWEKNGSSGGGGGGGGGGGSSSSSTGSNTATGGDNSNNTGNQQTGSGVNSSTGTQNEQPTSGTKINEPEANTGSNIQTGNQVDTLEQAPQNDNSNTQDSSPSSQNDGKTYTPEFQQAYEFAKGHGITTMPTIQKADMDGKLTRIAMAKMLSQYAINVLGKTPDATQNNKFNDVTDKLDTDYDSGVTLAYQLGIMGQNMPNNRFRPNDEVTRAEFATALSRMIYKTSDGEYRSTDKYYIHHMEKLVEEGIITKNDPKMKELRGYVMIMLMRSAK